MKIYIYNFYDTKLYFYHPYYHIDAPVSAEYVKKLLTENKFVSCVSNPKTVVAMQKSVDIYIPVRDKPCKSIMLDRHDLALYFDNGQWHKEENAIKRAVLNIEDIGLVYRTENGYSWTIYNEDYPHVDIDRYIPEMDKYVLYQTVYSDKIIETFEEVSSEFYETVGEEDENENI